MGSAEGEWGGICLSNGWDRQNWRRQLVRPVALASASGEPGRIGAAGVRQAVLGTASGETGSIGVA